MTTSGRLWSIDDPLHRLCATEAAKSPCQKMRFGCLVVVDGYVAMKGHNRTVPALASFCVPYCIRLGLRPRSDSMLGACGHAEEILWDALHAGLQMEKCELYVAGFSVSGEPWLKDRREHTCLRCALQMHNARIARVHVPTARGWEALTTFEALESALDFARRSGLVP